METKPVLAWMFVRENRHTVYDAVGFDEFEREYQPQLCEVGAVLTAQRYDHSDLTGSSRARDALNHAQGPIVCRIEMFGDVNDKEFGLVTAKHLRVLWLADASTILHEFACDATKRTLDRVHPSAAHKYNAVDVKRRWIRGEATDEELDAANRKAVDGEIPIDWDAEQSRLRKPHWAAYVAAGHAEYAASFCETSSSWLDGGLERDFLNDDLEARLMTLSPRQEESNVGGAS